MMTAPLSNNRGMFWRIVRRLLTAHRARLFVILLALGAGAAVTAALLNLQVDAKRRINSEFRAFGANIILIPSEAGKIAENSATFRESDVVQTVRDLGTPSTVAAPFLYFMASIQKANNTFIPERRKQIQVVGVGTYLDAPMYVLIPGWRNVPQPMSFDESDEQIVKKYCILGSKVSEQLNAKEGDTVELFYGAHISRLKIFSVVSTGSDVDNQIFLELEAAQLLTEKRGQASLVEINYPGGQKEIPQFVAELSTKLPHADVRPIRQFTEAQAKIYSRISGLLNFTVALVLVLTGLCVMAAMTNVAMERKNDVGLMKAIGGTTRRVLRLFLAEAALLGLAAGFIGAALGIAISIYLGKAVFGIAARPRLIVYPVSVFLTMIIAVLSAFPLRRLAGVRPASVFRGEA